MIPAKADPWQWHCTLAEEMQDIPPPMQYIHCTFHNKFFAVLAFKNDTIWGEVIQLSIRHKIDRPPTWDELVRVKEDLFPNSTAIEIIPPKKHMVDAANMHHLWILPIELPFGLHRRESWGKP